MTLFLGSRGYRNYFCARYSPDNFKQVSNLKEISKFWVAGINYKKTDATTRGEFAIQNDQYDRLLEQARVNDLDEVFVLSTCNRTEIYGFADNASQLIGLLCEQTAGNQETFLSSAYIKNGHEAIAHLFNVSAGLDSQILGDYEIIGQLKVAVKVPKNTVA
jgi:glutamyl-tRNA reductase